MTPPLPLLTIAGSDSGGAAGLQADLKTWAALGAYGMSAVTAVTAQNSARVAAVHYLPPEMIAAQIDAVLSDYGAAAIKTGFLGRVEIIAVVAERLAFWRQEGRLPTRPAIVIDPVLVNHRGEAMFPPAVADAYRAWLCPLADLVTPNKAEAALLGLADDGQQTTDPGQEGDADGQETVIRRLSPAVPRWLVKGASRTAGTISDVYWAGEARLELPQPRLDTPNTHGSGDSLSAAICFYVAQGHAWPEAIRRAQAFTHAAIGRGAAWRLGAGHGPVWHGAPGDDR